MDEYIEIEGPKELNHLNRVLSSKLKDALGYGETRTVGYPQGSFRAKVRFLFGDGDGVFWWAGRLSKDKTVSRNFFGHGTPGNNASLNIDVQFNLPVNKFLRKLGGTFLRHIPTGTVVLAHRGLVTLGHGRIPKSALFAEMAATLREANTSDGTNEFLLIGELESSALVNDIDMFSSELRRTVKAIKAKSVGKKEPHESGSEAPQKVPTVLPSTLREYFDEFSGQRNLKDRRNTVADCYHGTVVRALRDAFVESSEVFKTREIDLIVRTAKKAFVFEVKTSADMQSIYTAIGQLFVHAPVVAHHVGDIPLSKVIVLPEHPIKRLYSTLTGHLGICILTFTRNPQGRIIINGLNQLR